MTSFENKHEGNGGATASQAALRPAVLVDRSAELDRFLALAAQEPVIAVDTESNSLFAYHHHICLIQFSLPGGDFVVDPLAVDVTHLDGLFADPARQKIFHAAENDILGLKRDYAFAFANIFDTMTSARILGWEHVGLAAVLENLYGVTLDKRMQRTNWGKRPLDRQQLAYAQLDTHYLFALRQRQMQELRDRDRWEEALENFSQLPSLEYVPKPADVEGFWSLPGARKMPPTQLAVLRELYLLREEQASREDRPPFKVFDNRALVRIAEAQPETLDGLQEDARLAHSQVRRYGRNILKAVKRGQSAPPPLYKRTAGNGRRDPEVQERHDALRKWRTQRARQRGVDPDIVLTNDQLMVVARDVPANVEELAQTGVMGPWKLQEYGPDILDLLATL